MKVGDGENVAPTAVVTVELGDKVKRGNDGLWVGVTGDGVGVLVVGAAVVGAAVVGATVVGSTVAGATVVGAAGVGSTVAGAAVVGEGKVEQTQPSQRQCCQLLGLRGEGVYRACAGYSPEEPQA